MESAENLGLSHYDCIDWLWNAGVRFGTVIDLGCADGHFSVLLAESGPTRDSVILNIDAQEDYRDSLAAIQKALGGHFRFCAVGERDGGFIELQRGAHLYWSSLRPADDLYWKRLHGVGQKKPIKVPVRSLDSLVAETGAPAPYLLKLDIQGGEAAALAGARATLAQTEAVAIEIMIEDFAEIHRLLSDSDFVLFDLSQLNYTFNALAWFYAVYAKSRHAALRPARYWPAERTDDNIALQVQHREGVQNQIWASLDRHAAGKWPKMGSE